MFKDIVQTSREENKFLPYPIIPFVKVKGPDCRCELHKNLRMNPGTIKRHIRSKHKLNFETGEPFGIVKETLQDLPVEKFSANPIELAIEYGNNYFWELLRKVKAISKIKDPKYAMVVVKYGLVGIIKEDLLKMLEEKSSEIRMKQIDQYFIDNGGEDGETVIVFHGSNL